MAMRFGAVLPLLAMFVACFGAGEAPAQPSNPDSALYPMQAETPAASPPAKPIAKPAHKLAHKHASKPEVKAAVTPPAAPVLPLVKPEAAKFATANTSTVDTTVNVTPPSNVFAGIGPRERRKLQSALLWSGDYSAAVAGEDPMLTAVKNFQKRKKYKVTGTLTAAQRSELIGAAREHEAEFGWSVVADPATGIRIGLPAKMVPFAREAAHGTRWSSAHGEMQVETFRLTGPGLKLPALFEQEKSVNRRKVEYSVLRDDSFFVSGLQGLKKFSVRAQMRDGEVRGFTLLFDQAMEGIVAPVMVAMASAFSPFPQHGAPFATLSKSVEYGNGVIVSAQGHIVTDARLIHGCQVIVAAGLGDAERIAEDKDKGLALLRVYGPRQFKPLSLPRSGEALVKSGDVTLAGIPDPKNRDGRGQLAEIKARLTSENAIELRESVPMAGFSGAAALDGQGRFLGLTEMRNAVIASMEPAASPVRLVPAKAIRDFVDAHQVPAVAATAVNAAASVVRIICVRK